MTKIRGATRVLRETRQSDAADNQSPIPDHLVVAHKSPVVRASRPPILCGNGGIDG